MSHAHRLLLLVALVPWSLMPAALYWTFRCRHRGQEIFQHHADGRQGMECWRCGRWRPVAPDDSIRVGRKLTAPAITEAVCLDVIGALERQARRERAADAPAPRQGRL